MKLVIVGGGFTGTAVARRARAEGASVVATTRSEARAESLRATGAVAVVASALDERSLDAHVDEATCVLVTAPPDGHTDARLAPSLARAAAIAYVSSTAVYGDARGRVDEDTPLRADTPRAAARAAAEAIWRDAGASVVRAPGIYGPGRGLHLRLARGELRLAGDGANSISRVHVDDLAAALVTLLTRRVRGALYVMGDLEPAPHVEVVQWLCARLALPMPPQVPLAELDESLRNDRKVDASRIRRDLGLGLAYPSYREGFAQCIAADVALL